MARPDSSSEAVRVRRGAFRVWPWDTRWTLDLKIRRVIQGRDVCYV